MKYLTPLLLLMSCSGEAEDPRTDYLTLLVEAETIYDGMRTGDIVHENGLNEVEDIFEQAQAISADFSAVDTMLVRLVEHHFSMMAIKHNLLVLSDEREALMGQ